MHCLLYAIGNHSWNKLHIIFILPLYSGSQPFSLLLCFHFWWPTQSLWEDISYYFTFPLSTKLMPFASMMRRGTRVVKYKNSMLNNAWPIPFGISLVCSYWAREFDLRGFLRGQFELKVSQCCWTILLLSCKAFRTRATALPCFIV